MMKHFFSLAIIANSVLNSFAFGPPLTASLGESVLFEQFRVSTEVEAMEFEVRGTFKLGEASDGINLLTEPVTIKVGDLTANIAPGSFTQDDKGRFRLRGTFSGTSLDVKISVLANNSYEVKIEGEGARPLGKIQPENVGLWVGNDGGTAGRN